MATLRDAVRVRLERVCERLASQYSLEGFHATCSIPLNPSTAGLPHERVVLALPN
ncbi:hypothetical protein [Nostoc sp.]|uniref:hypothetical protein n=1 Tax=Nostoc sp. TaxID=1180 RepID=UPI002FF868AB